MYRLIGNVMNKNTFFSKLNKLGLTLTKEHTMYQSPTEVWKETTFKKGDVELIVTDKNDEVLYDTIVYIDSNDLGTTLYSSAKDCINHLSTIK